MKQSKSLALVLLTVAFIAGGVLGFAAARVTGSERESRGPRAYWDRIAKEWELTPQQRVVIDSLMDAQHRQIAALYRPIRPSIDSIKVLERAVSDSTAERMRAILTPAQRVKMDAMRAERRRHAAKERAQRAQDEAQRR